MKVAVFVPTFRRPHLLKKVLESLQRQSCSDFPIIISDNDSEQAEGLAVASAWAEALGITHRVHLTIARERGLTQNRNHALKLAFSEIGVDAVAMIDDDSEAHPEWVEKLKLGCGSGAELVGGPTIYRLSGNVSPDVRASSLFGVPYTTTGYVPRLRSSNNCVISRTVYERLGGRVFDPDFGATGGGDTFLFIGQKKQGTRTWWQNDAIVYEDVPDERATSEWVAYRQRTNAVNAARIDRRLSGPVIAWPRQAYLAMRDAANGCGAVVRGDEKSIVSLNFESAKGRFLGLFGFLSLHDTSKRS